MRSASTMVAVVAENARPAIVRLADEAANVAAEALGELPDSWSEAAVATRATWDRAVRHRLIYTVVDVDPLAPVVKEWSRRLLGQENELELAIGASNPPDPPDFYLVDERLGHPLVDWYLGHLRNLSPGRVVPVRLDPEAISQALGSLGYGPPFPNGKELAATAREFVPLPGLSSPPNRTHVRLGSPRWRNFAGASWRDQRTGSSRRPGASLAEASIAA